MIQALDMDTLCNGTRLAVGVGRSGIIGDSVAPGYKKESRNEKVFKKITAEAQRQNICPMPLHPIADTNQ